MNKIKRKIGILGANKPLLNFYKRARVLGYEIHAFAWEEGAVCKSMADYFYPISFTEVQTISNICKEKQIEMVTSFSLESALPYVYEIAQIMGWNFPSEACRMRSLNKLTMRHVFEQSGVSIPRFLFTKSEEQQLETFPVIVKPIDSGGSRGVTRVDNIHDLKGAIRRAKSFSASSQVLIEQFIDGPEYSVESISFEGKHHIAAITEKVTTGPPNFVELAHFQPAEMSMERKNKIEALVSKSLSALDYQQGPSHSEVKFDSTGECYLIEVGLRLGGDFITSDLVRLSTGYDIVEASIELCCGLFMPPIPKWEKHAGVYFKSFETQEIWSKMAILKETNFYVEGEEWSNEKTVVTESADRLGYLIYQHDERLKLNGTF